jgi:hypothetical protein
MQFRNYGGLVKVARSGFPWEKTTKGPVAFPDFLQRGTSREQLCAAFFTESRMQFDGTTKLHRKSGFGLHQLRNCFRWQPFVKFDIFGSFLGLAAQRGRAKGFFFIEKGALVSGAKGPLASGTKENPGP